MLSVRSSLPDQRGEHLNAFPYLGSKEELFGIDPIIDVCYL